MHQKRILGRVLRRTRAGQIGIGFLVFFILCSIVIWLREPEMSRIGDALWYCYTVVTTIGFGDITVTERLSRILSVCLSVYAALVLPIITGVVVSYYNEIVALRRNDTLSIFFDKLERLPELEPEELAEISERVRHFNRK